MCCCWFGVRYQISHQVKGEVRKMTNLEWLEFIYPDNEDLPYMYDSFDWFHCA